MSSSLSEQELLIARLISNGLTAKSIAQHLGVTISSVDYRVEQIKKKLGCNKNTQIAFYISKQ